MKFEELNIDPDILKVIHELRFDEPTEIQEKTIPLIKEGVDVIGESATGSGKTLAFAVQIIEKVQKGEGVQALVLVPTRELCEQVSKEIVKFSRYKSIIVATIYGGVSYAPQTEILEKAEVVVATPGRILDHIQKGTFQTHRIKILVIDETDRMFDMGFIHDVTEIIRNVPNKRQTMLFSATIDPDVEYIGKKYMKDPRFVSAVDHVDPSLLKQYYYEVGPGNKFSLLSHLLKNDRAGLVMVFCNTRKNVDFLSRNLRKQGIEAYPIHGGLTQSQRNKVMDMFRNHKIRVLVATDVAARGLDIKNVSHVYNYDSPKTEDEYIHRIGRTARAGKEGKAVSIISDRDYENFHRLQRDERITMEKIENPQFERIPFRIHADEHQRTRYRGDSHYNRSGGFQRQNSNRGYHKDDRHQRFARPGFRQVQRRADNRSQNNYYDTREHTGGYQESGGRGDSGKSYSYNRDRFSGQRQNKRFGRRRF